MFVKEQLPEAIARLHHAVEEEKKSLHKAEHNARLEGVDQEEDQTDEEHKSGRVGVHLGQRATPLIHLMEWTQKENGFILWEADKDF